MKNKIRKTQEGNIERKKTRHKERKKEYRQKMTDRVER
jgi:hypothetical protein